MPMQQTSYMIINPTIQQQHQPQQMNGYQMMQPIIYVMPQQNGMNYQNQYMIP